MAWLEQHPTSGRFKVCFRWGGHQFKKTVKTTDRGDAEGILRRVEETISLAERGRLEVPPGADVATFFLSDGKLPHKPRVEPPPKPLTLEELRDRYVQAHAQGAIEASSLKTLKMHLDHFIATLGRNFPVPGLKPADVQGHVDRRARQKGFRGRPISPTTLRKEVTSIRACWNWGQSAGLVSARFPGNKALKYPKGEEKSPFQTWEQIQRQVDRGGLTEAEIQDLWDCLFLTLPEVDELLAHVKVQARLPFLYPMFVLAAHTGARRSEMLRARVTDLDLEGQTVLLREKKRSKERRTYRRVPLSPVLAGVMRDWLGDHPGGQHLFCQAAVVVRSKTKRSAPTPVTRDEAHDHFGRTLAGSKWEVLRGWHAFRHSFCSNCAAAGVDQRLIDAWVGHQTDEMRRRYRHLIPNQERQAIQTVFGGVTAVATGR
jgi:integrase